MAQRTVFVTVGTTKFEKLTNLLEEKEFVQTLVALGYTGLIVQVF
jgi:UDP-N-acetylglucosamine transferase subunit ALG13